MIRDRKAWQDLWLKGEARDRQIYLNPGLSFSWTSIGSDLSYSELIREVQAEGDRLLQAPIPLLTQELFDLFRLQGTRLEYESVYFARRRRLITFTLLSLMNPDHELYRQQLIAIVSAVLDEPTWCLPAHMKGERVERGIDLFAAETGFALSELLTLMGEALPELLRNQIKSQVNRRLFTPYLQEGPYPWETADHNWAAVCAGAIGGAALLLEQDSQRLTEMITKVLDTLQHYLSGFGEDGACLEGLGYWNYGFGYYVYFADLLLRCTQGALDLLAEDKVKRIALFQQQCYLIGDRQANFSDAMPHVCVQLGLSDYLAARYSEVQAPPRALRAPYTDDHCSRFAPALRNFLWMRASGGDEAGEWPAGSHYLPDAAWLISRWSSPNGRFGFAAKGGHNGEPHNHIDVGHFLLLADDEPAFAADLGGGEYTAEYFGDGRYTYDCTGPQGHSLPVIGGCSQQPGAEHAAVVLEASQDAAQDVLELELVGTYALPSLSSLIRRFVWHKTLLPSLTVVDDYQFAIEAEDITEVLITRCTPLLAEPGLILLKGRQREVRFTYEAELLTPSIEPRSFSNHYGQEEQYYRILLKADRSRGHSLRIVLRFSFT